MKSQLTGQTPLLSARDVDFLLYEWLDAEYLCQRPRFTEHSAGTFDAVLDLAADIAAGLFAPHNKLADSAEIAVGPDGRIQTIPDTKKALDALSVAGLLAGEFDEDLGGMQLPYVISKAAFAWLQAANVSTSAYAGLTIASAHLLARNGTALAAEGKAGDFCDGKRAAARYFFSHELPKTAARFDLLASLERSMLELSESWLF